MSEEFDIGPLTWVKDEIDQALTAVLDNIESVATNPTDLSVLRHSQTHLYQVSGALDMVGLEGCKKFCAELEKVSAKLDKQLIAPAPELLTDLKYAITTLKDYLQDLLNGSPDVPVRLFSALKPLIEAQGEILEESDLFFPDTSNLAPKDLESKSLDDADYADYIVEQRVSYQKSLLAWLQKKQAADLDNMRLAIDNVSQVQAKASQKTLWWAASAFTESLADEKVSAHAGARRLCRRLDQELRSISEGQSKPHSNLLKDVLYFVAVSESTSESLEKVRAVFELNDLIPNKNNAVKVIGKLTKEQQDVIKGLITDLDDLKYVWHTVADDEVSALTNFCEKVASLTNASQQLENQAITDYFNDINKAAIAIHNNESLSQNSQEHAQVEIASALNLVEHTLDNYEQFNTETQQKLTTSAKRLQALAAGEVLADLAMADQLESETLTALVTQIKESLAVVEKSLDLFFRNPHDQSPLALAGNPLQQVIAAFDMLNMATPTAITNAELSLVNHFGEAGYIADQAQFELLAESLSMLGLYVDELPKVRPESESALASALDRLNREHLTRSGDLPMDAEQDDAAAKAEVDELEPQPLEIVETKSEDLVNEQSFVAKTSPTIDVELLDIFLTEAEEVLAQIAQNLQTLRVNNTDSVAMGEIRRGFHTLKGSGRTVGLNDLGAVAGFVEIMLNSVIEQKAFLRSEQVGFLEQTSAAFAAWAAELKDTGIATVNVAEWQDKVTSIGKTKVSSQIEEVVVGGTRKMSRGLYNVFLQEAKQNLALLQADVTSLSENSHAKNVQLKPSETSRRAVHTLASNALTAGFKPMGELGRALENWLDAFKGGWTNESVILYRKSIKSLADMLERASKLLHPRAAPALIKALKNSTGLHAISDAETLASAVADVTDISSAVTEAIGVNVLDVIELEDSQTEVAYSEHVLDDNSRESISNEDIDATAEIFSATATSADRELLNIFIEEARELIPQMGSELRAWHGNSTLQDLPDALQRTLHTLKGSARMAGQVGLGDTVHELEDQVIRALKRNVVADDFDEMFVSLDEMGNLFDSVIELNMGETIDQNSNVQHPTRSAERGAQYLRLRAEVLDRLINEAGEISIARSRMDREMQGFKGLSLDLTESVFRLRNYLRELELEADTQLQSRLSILQESNETFDPLEFDRFTRLQELTRMMAESVNDVATIQHGLLMNLDQTESALQQQNRMNRELQQALMSVRMLPFSLLTERLHRIVRQTARELNKRVEMVIDGEGVELDRSVLDKIGAPLEHLLRNAVAHGIEMPNDRKKLGKDEAGTISIKVRQENNEIIIVVSDDGSGVALARVKEKAINNGLITESQEVSDQALMSIIFEPGFSTASEVSQISGRGVGLDSVRGDISGLGGRIDVDSVSDQSTVFTIYIPVTLSVAQVLIVRVGTQTFALPVTMIEQAQKIKKQELLTAYQQGHVTWANKQYALHYLAKLVGVTDVVPEMHNYTSILLLRSSSYHTALHVDEIIGNQEVVMKPIGAQLSRAPGMVGATVTGDGSIVLIINPVQLANREMLSVGSVKVQVTAADIKIIKPSVMVVDDSLTMRKVLGRLLEREGFEVIIAKDGMDAMQLLQDTTPDIILTDIEMPRMDGFGLARNIRDDVRTKHTPVIMISSRTAEKHRKVASELGVNAFFGKPVADDELVAKIKELLATKQLLNTLR